MKINVIKFHQPRKIYLNSKDVIRNMKKKSWKNLIV